MEGKKEVASEEAAARELETNVKDNERSSGDRGQRDGSAHAKYILFAGSVDANARCAEIRRCTWALEEGTHLD